MKMQKRIIAKSLYMALVIISFLFFFRFIRVCDISMYPGLGEGDLVVVCSFDKQYSSNDIVVYKYKNKYQVRRVVAIEGDTVNISPSGLLINGKLQNEHKINGRTMAYKEGIRFPITLKKGEVFLMADSRENTSDSRLYGAVKEKSTLGRVEFVIRHNNL